MDTSAKTGILKIYVGETDNVHGRSLYEEIVFEARKKGLAGATVYKGSMSFGASHSIHTIKFFSLSGDLPVIIEIVDEVDKLNDFVNTLNSLMDLSKKGGLVTLQDINVLRYSPGIKYKMNQ